MSWGGGVGRNSMATVCLIHAPQFVKPKFIAHNVLGMEMCCIMLPRLPGMGIHSRKKSYVSGNLHSSLMF
jgi:hypothetical protein